MSPDFTLDPGWRDAPLAGNTAELFLIVDCVVVDPAKLEVFGFGRGSAIIISSGWSIK